MPTYDFQCDQCRAIFEVRATFHEKAIGLNPVCPRCQAKGTHQILPKKFFIIDGNSDKDPLSSSSCDPNVGSGCCGR